MGLREFRFKPELVVPAGDLEKVKTALRFGADGIYAGGANFSLRAAAGNLSLIELQEAVRLIHAQGKRLYIAVNILANNHDLSLLPPYLEELAALAVDGLIVSDPGVIRLARRFAPDLALTLSTQANVSNYESAAFFQEQGINRIVLARELSLEELYQMRQRLSVELEVFVQGAMCMAYSGRCLISHYMTGRSANRGACAHPCRYSYALVEEQRPEQYFPLEEDERGSYILNSCDLCLLEYLPQLMEIGIDAFKIEGRMKSPLYVATTASIYRRVIDETAEGMIPQAELTKKRIEELAAVSPRPFTRGFIERGETVLQDVIKIGLGTRHDFLAMVIAGDASEHRLELEQRANFGPGETGLEMLIPEQGRIPWTIERLWDEQGQELDRARHPRQHVFCSSEQPIPSGSILLRRRES